MRTKRIRLTRAAYERLKRKKLQRESISEVVLREIPVSCETAGEILGYFQAHAVPKADPKMRAELLAGRGMRSARTCQRRKT